MGLLPGSLQELEQVGRCRRASAEGSELPRVSGASARLGAGRLASVSRAASSQEPEPGPGGQKKKIPNGKLDYQRSLALTCHPYPTQVPLCGAPHHHWPLAPVPPLHREAADLVSRPQTVDPLQPQGEHRGQTGRG